MDVRLTAIAILALIASSCSSVYETVEFMKAPAEPQTGQTTNGQPDEASDPAKTAAGQDNPSSQNAAPPEPGTDAKEMADTSKPAATAENGEAAKSAERGESPAPGPSESPANEPRGFLSMFKMSPTPPPAAAAEAVVADAEKPDQAGTQASPNGTDVDIEEISEAELAGEVEADPEKVAVPEEPIDDGLEHDFVNVYTSRPEKQEPSAEGLPGVTWEGGIVLVSRGMDDDPNSLFEGGTHPFAQTVPGVPRQVVQAANGLLLAHSAINVNCVKSDLLTLVRRAEGHFGKKVVVTSGYRSPAHNRSVHGAKHSQHMYCNALDLYMPGIARDDLARFFYAQPDRGGIGLYCHTRSIHIDTGKRRQWRWGCRRRAG